MSLLILSLATWRITRMVMAEDGPGNVFGKLRQWIFSGIAPGTHAKPGTIAYLFTCPYCLSVWFSALFSLFIASGSINWLMLTLAGSAGSIMIRLIEECHQNHWSLKRAEIDLLRVQVNDLRMQKDKEKAPTKAA